MSVVKDLGAVSAYALAVKYGYTGTEEEWVTEQEAKRIQTLEAAANAATNASTATTAAAEAKTAAVSTLSDKEEAARSAAEAKTYMENAQAIAGAGIATKDTAGFMKGGENNVTEDGTLELTRTTTERTIQGTYAGGVKINEIRGGSKQVRTTGAQLFDARARTSGVNISTSSGNTYEDSNTFATAYIAVNGFTNIVTNMQSSSNGYIWGVFYDESKSMISTFNKAATGKNTFEVPTEAYYVRIGCLNTLLDTAILASGTVLPDWEPYTGGAPSPAPGKVLDIPSGTNLLKNTLTSQTINGVELTVNADKSITFSGTSTMNMPFHVGTAKLEAGTYILSGLRSAGMSYKLNFFYTEADGETINSTVIEMPNEDYIILTEATTVTCELIMYEGGVYDNVTVYPMIAVSIGAEYEAYKPTYTEGYPQEIKGVKGKNLLDCRGLTEQTIKGVTFTPVYDSYGNLQYIEINGTPTADIYFSLSESFDFKRGNSYILNGCPNGGNISKYFLYINNVPVYDYGSGATYTPNEDEGRLVGLCVKTGVAITNLRFYPMIRPASIADNTYVPYGLLRFKMIGKNFIDLYNRAWASNVSATFIKDNGTIVIKRTANQFSGVFSGLGTAINLLKGKTVTVSFYAKTDTIGMTAMCYLSGNTNYFFDLSTNYKRFSFTHTVTEDSAALCFYGNNVSGYMYIKDIQIEEGEVMTDYEPYQEKSIILSNPITLHGIGDVKDRIVKQDGVWGVERNVLVSGLRQRSVVSNDYGYTFYGAAEDYYRPFESTGKFNELVCTHLQSVNKIIWNPTDISFPCMSSGIAEKGQRTNANIFFPKEYGIDTAEKLIKWGDDNGVKIYGKSPTPTFEPLPTADQIALHSLLSYDSATHIITDTEIEPEIEVEVGTSKVGGYTLETRNREMRNEIKIAQLESAILSVGGNV